MNSRFIRFPETGSFFLFGARQTGKTTIVQSRYPEAWYVNLLQEETFYGFGKEPGLFRRQAEEQILRQGKKTIIIDEVQRIPELLNDVQVLIDRFNTIRFVLTGSSARKLKRKGVNLLAGRAVDRRLFPYISSEIASDFSLETVLKYGTLPGIYGKSPETMKDQLTAYVNTYLREEIRQEGLVRKLGGFSRFLDIAASQNAEIVSFSDMARECGVSSHTIKSHYEVLEDTMIVFALHPWQRSTRKRLVAHKRLGMELEPGIRGRLFEAFVILELYRRIHYAASDATLYFWRTNMGAEVDCVVENHGKLVAACEIKSSRVIDGRDLSGLKSFRDDNPDTPCFVASITDVPYEKNGVRILPWPRLIQELAEKF
jgi:predicted AAA+ superfamily ATPase